MGKWNHLKIIHKVPEQHNVKARNQRTAENSPIGPYAHTSGSTNVREQNFQYGKYHEL